jgi:hypothetical protein
MNKNSSASLITRECRCGCGKTWRTLEASTNFYFSETHRHWSTKSLLGAVRDKKAELKKRGVALQDQLKEWHAQKLPVFEMTARLNAMGYRTPRKGARYAPKQIYNLLWNMKLITKVVAANRRRAKWRGEE